MNIVDEVDQMLAPPPPVAEPKKNGKKAAVSAEKAEDIQRLQHWGFCGERVECVIEAGHTPVEKLPVFVRLNDYTCEIPRGERVALPVEVVQHLETTVQTSYTQPESGVLIPHSHLRHPIRRLGLPS